jgi:hypothetical protein
MRKQKVDRDRRKIRSVDGKPLVLLGGKRIDYFDILTFYPAEILQPAAQRFNTPEFSLGIFCMPEDAYDRYFLWLLSTRGHWPRCGGDHATNACDKLATSHLCHRSLGQRYSQNRKSTQPKYLDRENLVKDICRT